MRILVTQGESKKGGNGKEKDENSVSKFDGECRYCQKKGHKKSECGKMKADHAAEPGGVNSFKATGAMQPSSQASDAPTLAKAIQMQQIVPAKVQNPLGNQEQTETWFINMTTTAQKILKFATLGVSEHALWDSESGVTSFQSNCAGDPTPLPRFVNPIILTSAAGDSVERIGLRRIGCGLETGGTFVVTSSVDHLHEVAHKCDH